MRKIGLLAALALLAAWPLQAQLSGVTAQLQLAQDQYLPGEDLQLKVRITNRSGQEIILGADNDWLVMSIMGEHNVACPRLGDMPLQGGFSLLSGEVGTRPLNPTPCFDFRLAGPVSHHGENPHSAMAAGNCLQARFLHRRQRRAFAQFGQFAIRDAAGAGRDQCRPGGPQL